MLQKTISWIPTKDKPPLPDAIVIASFEKSFDDASRVPCFVNYSEDEKKFFDDDWNELDEQPTYWAYYVGPFDK